MGTPEDTSGSSGRISPELREKLRLIASKMEEVKQVQGEKVTFKLPAFNNLLFVLLHYSDVIKEMPEFSGYILCREAASEVGRRGIITAEALYEEIGRRVGIYRAQAPREFALITTISVIPPEDLHRRTVDGWEISLATDQPGQFDRSFLQGTTVHGWKPYGQHWMWLIARGTARSNEEALDRAIRSVDLMRGIWNLGHGAGTAWSMDPDVSHGPTSVILVGPVFTVHEITTTPKPGSWAFDPTYCPGREEPQTWPLQNERWNDVRFLETRISPEILQAPMRPFVTEAVIRYCRALDTPDPESRFVALWGVLEHLTGPGAALTSKTLLKRVGNTYSEWSQLDRITLEMLREQRDASVHRGVASQFRKAALSILINTASDLLVVLLKNHHEFLSRERFWEFLDLPAERQRLEDAIALRQLAMKLRGYDSPSLDPGARSEANE